MKVTILSPSELLSKVIPSTRGSGKLLETIVFSRVGISTKMTDNSNGKQQKSQEKGNGEETLSAIGFLRGNPLLERIKYFTQTQRSWPERLGLSINLTIRKYKEIVN